MSKSNRQSADPFSNKSVLHALKAWDDLRELGEHSLARLKIVRTQHQIVGRLPSITDLGLSLRDVLRVAIDNLRPNHGEPIYTEQQWRPYIILKEEYVDGRDPKYLAVRLNNIALRTYQHSRQKAVAKLASLLRQMEDEAKNAPDNNDLATPFLAPPKPPYSLVDRYNLLESIKKRLFNDRGGAVSALSGLPGIGKTALAIELAHDPEVLARFQDGVLWAGLGRKPNILAHLGIWGAALGIPAEEMAKLVTVSDRAKALHRAIGMRSMLLLIDDVWQLESALAFRVGGPRCGYLLTTRTPSIAQNFAEKGATKVTELSQFGGLVLLTEFAKDFANSRPDDAMRFVQAAGGLPLALILIAKYVRREARKGQRGLTNALNQLQRTEKILKLEQPQEPITSHPSLAVGEPVTLKRIIDISIKALDKPSRSTLWDLSVLPPKPSTFSKEAALAISAKPMETIDNLVDIGLLEYSRSDRYTLHQTIADYAKLKLDVDSVYGRMAMYFANFAETYERNYDALEKEVTNLDAALEISSQRQINDSLIREANSLYSYWESRGLYQTAELYLKQAQEAAEVSKDHFGLVTVLLNLGKVMEARGEQDRAKEYLNDGLALAKINQLHERTCDLLQVLGWIVKNEGDFTKAKKLYQESLTLAEEVGYHDKIIHLLQSMGAVEGNLGNFVESERYMKQGLDLARHADDRERISALLQNLGWTVAKNGKYSQAEEFFTEALELAREMGHFNNISALLQSLGVVKANQGDDAQAEALYLEALKMAREMGRQGRICLLLINLGKLEEDRENYEQAETLYLESLVLAREMEHRERSSILLANLGAVAIAQGAYAVAEKYVKESLDLANEMESSWLICSITNIWGDLYFKQKRLNLASAKFSKALKVSQEIGAQEAEADALFGLGKVAEAQGNTSEAQRLGQESLNVFDTIGHHKSNEITLWLAELNKGSITTRSDS